jgi:hypothetical protein
LPAPPVLEMVLGIIRTLSASPRLRDLFLADEGYDKLRELGLGIRYHALCCVGCVCVGVGVAIKPHLSFSSSSVIVQSRSHSATARNGDCSDGQFPAFCAQTAGSCVGLTRRQRCSRSARRCGTGRRRRRRSAGHRCNGRCACTAGLTSPQQQCVYVCHRQTAGASAFSCGARTAGRHHPRPTQ